MAGEDQASCVAKHLSVLADMRRALLSGQFDPKAAHLEPIQRIWGMHVAALQTSPDLRDRDEVHLTAESLAANYLGRVYRFAVMLSPSGVDHEDLAQQAMLRALAGVDRFDPRRGSAESWLWRVVVSVARDYGRVARRRDFLATRLFRHHEARFVVSPESVALDRLRDADLVAAVRRLPRRYRSLIALRYGAGLSSPEVAELLGTTRMAVAKATRRALDKLRADLSDLEIAQ